MKLSTMMGWTYEWTFKGARESACAVTLSILLGDFHYSLLQLKIFTPNSKQTKMWVEHVILHNGSPEWQSGSQERMELPEENEWTRGWGSNMQFSGFNTKTFRL